MINTGSNSNAVLHDSYVDFYLTIFSNPTLAYSSLSPSPLTVSQTGTNNAYYFEYYDVSSGTPMTLAVGTFNQLLTSVTCLIDNIYELPAFIQFNSMIITINTTSPSDIGFYSVFVTGNSAYSGSSLASSVVYDL